MITTNLLSARIEYANDYQIFVQGSQFWWIFNQHHSQKSAQQRKEYN